MIDTSALKQLVNHLIDQGVAGLFPGGTTGEGFLLSLDERRLAQTKVVRFGRVRVLAQWIETRLCYNVR